MNTPFDIEQLIAGGVITNELDYERAMIADRKLRLLAKDNVHFKQLRKKLRDLIEAYENNVWTDLDALTEEKMVESDRAERIAEQERCFLEHRKQLIRDQLRSVELTQENLGQILGHKSKTHMSELMNGISPFTLKDIVIINKILGIDFKDLIPGFLSGEERLRVLSTITSLNTNRLTSKNNDLRLCIE